MDKGNRMVLEVRTDSGELLFKLRIIVKNEADPEPQKEENKTDKGNGGNGKGDGEKKGSKQSGNYLPMTDAQKRYLFRLLAGQGIEGDAAYEALKSAFSVDSLKKVTKLEASREIEKRLAKEKGGAANGQV